MKKVSSSLVLMMSLGLAACSGASTADGGEERKVVQREEVPDSRFAPDALEDTIGALIEGIETSSASDELALGVLLKELDGFWRPVVVGANRALGELEVIGQVQGATIQEQATEEQIAYLEDQYELGVDGIAIAPHNDEMIPYMDKFSDDDKPVLTVDSDLPDSKRDLFIGTDNTNAGTTGGETLAEILGDTTGHVIVLGNSNEEWVDGLNRTMAAVEVLEDAGNTVTIANSIWDPDEEVAQIKDIVDGLDGPVVGMLGVFANAYALATAATDMDLDDVKIVAFDFEPDTLSFMQDGVISATHVQRQYYMGYLAVYTLYSIHAVGLQETKDALGDNLIDGYHMDTGLDVIRAQDLEEYSDFNDELGI